MTHRTNIIYEGDAVAMISCAGVGPGDSVLEIGTGSGGLTLYLAFYIVRNTDQGKLVSVDVRPEHSDAAKKNLEKFNLLNEQVEFLVGDIDQLQIDNDRFDAVFIDMQTPWNVLKTASGLVKPGASIVIFLPNWYQVEKTCKTALDLGNLTVFDVFESNRRPMDVKPERHVMRPKFRSISYSGILIHLIKTTRI